MHAATQLKDAQLPMARDELTECQIDRLPLCSGACEALCFAHDVVVDLNVGAHTHEVTHPMVYARA